MKKIVAPLLIALAAIVFLPLHPCPAAGHGIGIDLIRLVDENQDGGMVNVHGQVGITADTALSLGYAKGDDLTIIDAGVKYYFGRYMNSPFIQLGAARFDHDIGTDTGFAGSLGLEHMLTSHIGFSSAVRVIAGVDREIAGYPASPLFQAVFSLMFAF
jgi:hypothetical protein